MELDRKVCDRARRSRDARFDGKFFIAVTSTRIYCRPICPARSPKDENVRYYPTAAAAEAAGFRPCLRCHPEASPGTPAWYGTSSIVSRALRLIGDGALDREGVEALADRLGVTARHLRRLFVQHLGATPIEVALTRRVHFAKKLLDETRLPIAQIAFASGFGSLRRFNGEIRRTFSRTPAELRKRARKQAGSPECYRFRLAYRPPYDWQHVIGFLRARATPGVELVEDDRYQRTIAVGGTTGTIAIGPADGSALLLEVQCGDPRALLTIVERVRRMFDLGADPSVIAGQLSGDSLLRRAVAAHAGIRTPGAWDAFEVTVRAILGQQISVKAATTIAGRIATRWGTPVGSAESGVKSAEQTLTRLFPTPAQLADAPLEEAGITSSRAATLRGLSAAVRDGAVVFDGLTTLDSLRAIAGIGEWTAQYVAMRALNEPDAFPSGDLILRRMAGDCSARELERRSEAWRPWRAYAVMLLWQEQADRSTGRQADRGIRHAHVGSHLLARNAARRITTGAHAR
ncbi:MAG: helix-turn-helix domain-containing protein [Cyanobacteria bacterium]|nr:helix-turn-helix domain-containing protein [Cyanobacteriota bacterium]